MIAWPIQAVLAIYSLRSLSPTPSFPPFGFYTCLQSNNIPANWCWNILCPGKQHLTVLSKAAKLSDISAKIVNVNPFT